MTFRVKSMKDHNCVTCGHIVLIGDNRCEVCKKEIHTYIAELGNRCIHCGKEKGLVEQQEEKCDHFWEHPIQRAEDPLVKECRVCGKTEFLRKDLDLE